MNQAERLIAWRYLRPTKGEGFISVIAAFALVGIALGVGTLIVVLAVMNGFRSELLGRVLGVNGHATIVAGPQGLIDDSALLTALKEKKIAGALDNATAPGGVDGAWRARRFAGRWSLRPGPGPAARQRRRSRRAQPVPGR